MKNKDAKLDLLPTEILGVADQVQSKLNSGQKITIDDAFHGTEYASIRDQLRRGEIATLHDRKGGEHLVAVESNEDGEIFAVAAAIPRKPGPADDYLSQIANFKRSKRSRADLIDLYWEVYKKVGLVNNSVNKSAALLGTKGSFKIRSIKGSRRKSAARCAAELKAILQHFYEKLNGGGEDDVINGSAGIPLFIAQGARQSLVEGDLVSRTVWSEHLIPSLGKKYWLPLTMQTFSAKHIEIPEYLAGTGKKIIYWIPSKDLLAEVKKWQKNPEMRSDLLELLGEKVIKELAEKKKYRFDSGLLAHVQHRGVGPSVYGESFIESALKAIEYQTALDSLEMVTVENLMNRLLIISVGDSNPQSVYHAAAVSNKRLQLLQRMLKEAGPSALLLWAGPDIDTKEVGAHNKLLDTPARAELADGRVQDALGVPSALLTGAAKDGKAAGWAATIGLSAQLGELGSQFAAVFTAIGRRIAKENGFDADVVFSFAQSLLANREANANIATKSYQLGTTSIRTYHEEMGIDHDAEVQRMKEEVEAGYRDEMFGPPRSMLTTNPTGAGGEDGGRPRQEENPGERDPRSDQETLDDEERK
jgi:hypothetical protein